MNETLYALAIGGVLLLVFGLIELLDTLSRRLGGPLQRVRRRSVNPLLEYLTRNVRLDMTDSERELFVLECRQLTGWSESRARSTLAELQAEHERRKNDTTRSPH